MDFCVVIKADYADCPPLLRLVTYLSRYGHSVDVFCVGSKTFKKNDKYLDKYGRVKIIKVPPAKGLAIHARPVIEIPRIQRALSKSNKIYNICVAFDPYALEATKRSHIFTKSKIIYYSLELWDELRFWPQRVCEYHARKIIDGLVVPQEDRLNYLVQILGYKGPSVVFPNITFDYNDQLYKEEIQTSVRPPTVFAYIGGLQKGRAIPQLIDVFGNRITNARLIIYGKGSEQDLKYYMGLINNTVNPSNIEVHEFLPYPEHFRMRSKWHVGIMLYENISLNYSYCAPNKLYEYTMLGLPILCSNQPHLRRIVEDQGIGISVNPRKTEQIDFGVRWFLNNNLVTLGKKSRDWFLINGNYEKYFQEFLKLCYDIQG